MLEDRPRWRQYRVSRRITESENIVSLHLVAADDRPLLPFRPGQFLTFRLKNSAGRPIPRNYSISSDPADRSHFRISVKRELAPPKQPDLPPGIGSGHMHDAALEGAILEASDPKGDFILEESTRRPVILLAGGIGITPLLAMAHALQHTSRDAFLVHACENGAVQPFREEIRGICAAAPNIRAFTCLNKPTAEDIARKAHQFEGFVNADALRSILPIGDYDAYLCGPPGFMQAMYALLISLGVRESQIRYEFFGPATVLKNVPAAPPPAIISAAPQTAPTGITVTFAKSGLSLPWDGSARTLLDFAEAHGLSPAFSCRNGICSTCLCEVEGELTYLDEPLDMPEPGKGLICCTKPKTSVILKI